MRRKTAALLREIPGRPASSKQCYSQKGTVYVKETSQKKYITLSYTRQGYTGPEKSCQDRHPDKYRIWDALPILYRCI